MLPNHPVVLILKTQNRGSPGHNFDRTFYSKQFVHMAPYSHRERADALVAA
jgi:hypothetical protein